jgi:hypothetical protein
MELNDKNIKLLNKVRERMFKDMEDGTYDKRPYICWNIIFVAQGLQSLPRGTQFYELVTLEEDEEVRAMVEAVENALENRCTFCNWLDAEVYHLGLRIKFPQAEAMGRIAWLDRMIERRVIA